MLPKKNRLPRANFSLILKKGKTIHTTHFVLRSITNPNQTTPLFGIIASHKVGSSASRNQCKRRLRAIIINLLKDITPEIQAIFICKKQMLAVDYHTIEKGVMETLQSINALRQLKTETGK